MQQHKSTGLLRPALLASTIALITSGHAMAEQITFHSDHARTTAKLIIEPTTNISSDMNEDLARGYINSQFRRFGLSKAQDMRLVETRKSLLGTHYSFQQYLGNVPVDKAQVIVTIAKDGHTISKVYNSAFKTTPMLQRRALLTMKPSVSAGNAIDNAWNILQVRDKLTSAPKSDLVYYVDEKGAFHLSHRVHIAAEGDTGGRMMYIDANRGTLLHDYSTTLRRHGNMPSISELNLRKGPVLDRAEQSSRFDKVAARPIAVASAVSTATAQVFDPDPRTHLQDATLEDNTSASSFDAAYVSRTLQGVNLSNGVYSLSGQYVNITEIETPNRAPSTSSTGAWTAKRGNNAFNDVTTYFHLDQNQRYIQSLGFTGSTGIIERALRVDTDGVQGADNSHYSYGGSTDYLAFGHGGVDDNEDADVILHEYGHAIHRNINSNWSGGDTGAMGEGFGDYWAGSYSYSTTNGKTFNPDWVMTWDGHSSSSWAGRVMNRTSAQYDFSHTYSAHSNHNGVNGDELWSTPLFQALKELMAAGRDRTEMDKIILQAHFGLGSNLKMRDVATSIVATATSLYPSGPHADVYRTHFENHGMIEATGGGGGTGGSALENGVAKSGLAGAKDNQQLFTFDVPAGATDLTFVTAGGSGDADLYVKFGSAPTTGSYECRSWNSGNGETCDVSSAQTGTYHVLINAYSTYSGMSLTASYTAGGGGGGNEVKFFENLTDVAIKDKKTSQSVLAVANSGSGGTISVNVDIKHTYVGDLRIDLVAPGGAKTFRLKDTSNDSSDDLLKTYSVDASGVSYNGDWTLKVYDAYNGDTGKIDSWSITLP
jgi:Zn-dependent metalloprotease